jgi:ribosomal-protein-alanine N-acetyltransferase
VTLRLDTPRLILREFVEDDWRAMHAIHAREDVVRWLIFEPFDEDAAREYVQGIMVSAREVPRLVFDFAITVKGDDTLRGRVGMKRDDKDPRTAMLWFVLDPALQGQGYVTEAARALVHYAFTELKLHRVWGDCDPRNPASARVMERLGMRREGHLVQNMWIKGEWCDSWIFAVLADEWAVQAP